jgi:hypothetical protein
VDAEAEAEEEVVVEFLLYARWNSTNKKKMHYGKDVVGISLILSLSLSSPPSLPLSLALSLARSLSLCLSLSESVEPIWAITRLSPGQGHTMISQGAPSWR